MALSVSFTVFTSASFFSSAEEDAEAGLLLAAVGLGLAGPSDRRGEVFAVTKIILNYLQLFLYTYIFIFILIENNIIYKNSSLSLLEQIKTLIFISAAKNLNNVIFLKLMFIKVYNIRRLQDVCIKQMFLANYLQVFKISSQIFISTHFWVFILVSEIITNQTHGWEGRT